MGFSLSRQQRRRTAISRYFVFTVHGTCNDNSLHLKQSFDTDSLSPPPTSLLSVIDPVDDVHLIISKADLVFSVDRFEVSALWLMVTFSEWNK